MRDEDKSKDELIFEVQKLRAELAAWQKSNMDAKITNTGSVGEVLAKNCEPEMEELYRKYAAIVEHSSDAIFSATPEGIMISWNKAAEKIYGFIAGEIIGRHINLLVPPQKTAELARFIKIVRDGKSISGFETVRRRRDGRLLHVSLSIFPLRDETGAVSGFSTIARDVTERRIADKKLKQYLKKIKQQAEQLKYTQERFSKAFNASPAAEAILSLTTGTFLEANQNFLELTGLAREMLIGSRVLNLSLLEKPAQLKKIVGIHKAGNTVRNREISFRYASGETGCGLLSTEALTIGNEPCVLVVIRDITDLKRYEFQMAHLERLKLIGQMSAGLAHEVRNPLTSVKGFLQLMNSSENCTTKQDYYNLMLDEIDRANVIISEFLALARDKSIIPVRQNLNHLIRRIYPLLNAAAISDNKSVRLDLIDLPDLNLDEREIRQLLHNLVRNGLEAMSDGGQITIHTYLAAGQACLEVADQGSGIPLEVLPKIGAPFVTTKEKGTGLGLAVCYSIAERHQARIKFKTGSKGTKFLIYFPILSIAKTGGIAPQGLNLPTTLPRYNCRQIRPELFQACLEVSPADPDSSQMKKSQSEQSPGQTGPSKGETQVN